MLAAITPTAPKTGIPSPSSIPSMPDVKPPKQTKPYITLEEQETIIIISRTSPTVRISTTDQTMVTKLNNLCEKAPDQYRLIRTDGEYENFYEVADKSLISFRQKKREVTEEQRQAAGERFRQLHASGALKKNKDKNKENNKCD